MPGEMIPPQERPLVPCHPLSRLPQVIGNYHFHPQEQAEYRHPEDLGQILPKLLKI